MTVGGRVIGIEDDRCLEEVNRRIVLKDLGWTLLRTEIGETMTERGARIGITVDITIDIAGTRAAFIRIQNTDIVLALTRARARTRTVTVTIQGTIASERSIKRLCQPEIDRDTKTRCNA